MKLMSSEMDAETEKWQQESNTQIEVWKLIGYMSFSLSSVCL